MAGHDSHNGGELKLSREILRAKFPSETAIGDRGHACHSHWPPSLAMSKAVDVANMPAGITVFSEATIQLLDYATGVAATDEKQKLEEVRKKLADRAKATADEKSVEEEQDKKRSAPN